MRAIDLITKQDLANFKTEFFTELKKLNVGSTTDKDRPEWAISCIFWQFPKRKNPANRAIAGFYTF